MTYNPRQVRELTTRSEHELVSASYDDSIGQLSSRALKSNIARTRRLRDKQRDLYQRQRLASRARTGTKQGSRPPSNARTGQKAQIFDETLSRFTQRLEALKAAERRPKKSAARKKGPPKPASRGSKGPKPPGARKTSGQAALRQKRRSPRMKAMQAHVSSRGRRKQARRDSR